MIEDNNDAEGFDVVFVRRIAIATATVTATALNWFIVD